MMPVAVGVAAKGPTDHAITAPAEREHYNGNLQHLRRIMSGAAQPSLEAADVRVTLPGRLQEAPMRPPDLETRHSTQDVLRAL